MNKFKIFQITFICIQSLWISSNSQLNPLNEILAESEIEPTTYIYTSNRCAGLYLASSEFLQGKLRDKYMLDATNLLTVSRNILSKVSDLDVMEDQAFLDGITEEDTSQP